MSPLADPGSRGQLFRSGLVHVVRLRIHRVTTTPLSAAKPCAAVAARPPCMAEILYCPRKRLVHARSVGELHDVTTRESHRFSSARTPFSVFTNSIRGPISHGVSPAICLPLALAFPDSTTATKNGDTQRMLDVSTLLFIDLAVHWYRYTHKRLLSCQVPSLELPLHLLLAKERSRGSAFNVGYGEPGVVG